MRLFMRKLLLSLVIGLGSLTAASAMVATPNLSGPQSAQLQKSFLMIEAAITEAEDELELLRAKELQAELRSAEAELDRAANTVSGTLDISDIVRTELADIEVASVVREINILKQKLKELEYIALKYGYKTSIWTN